MPPPTFKTVAPPLIAALDPPDSIAGFTGEGRERGKRGKGRVWEGEGQGMREGRHFVGHANLQIAAAHR